MIDFTRAFRTRKDLEDPKKLVMCDRQLLEQLRQLNENDVREKTKAHLRDPEILGIMARRDKIIAHFEQLIAQKGESAVLY